MELVKINDIMKYVNKNVVINGWVYNSRRSGKIGFLSLRDGYGIIQCIIEKKMIGEEKFELFKSLTQESSISIHGKVVANPRKNGEYEILVDNLILHQLTSEYPITPKDHGPDFLMNHRHLWLRSKRQHAILRIRHEIIKSIRNFFTELDCFISVVNI